MKTNSDGLVIIPTYNEKENIADIIRAVMNLEKNFHVLVVDDGSPDGTAKIVKDLIENQFLDRLLILERKGKLGLGTAYLEGFSIGIEKEYAYIFEMDADFSHNPKDLLRLHDACLEGADVAIGSRYVKGGGVRNWPKNRLLLSYGASLYVRIITWMNVKDPTAGFICYKRKVLESIDFNKIKFIGYAFQIEMKFAAHSLGYKIKEVPIIFIDRERGVSKMNSGIISEAVFGVIKIKLRNFFGSYKK